MAQVEPLHSRLRRVISDSYYETRNEGGTMESAATLAADRCEMVVGDWLQASAADEATA